jgi:predicted lipoprotein with Yx(FWY)xxD motif
MKRIFLPALGLAATAVIAAGCGGNSSTSYGGAQTNKPKPAAASTAAKVMTSKTSLGTIIVDGQGNTLYMFEKDKGGKSSCGGACAAAWPPAVTSGKPTAAGAVSAAKLGTTKSPDGKTMVTYAGWPLYRYAGDSAAGDTNGQNLNQFGAEWYVLGANGKKVERH